MVPLRIQFSELREQRSALFNIKISAEIYGVLVRSAATNNVEYGNLGESTGCGPNGMVAHTFAVD